MSLCRVDTRVEHPHASRLASPRCVRGVAATYPDLWVLGRRCGVGGVGVAATPWGCKRLTSPARGSLDAARSRVVGALVDAHHGATKGKVDAAAG